MHRRHRAGRRIREQERDAVGHAHRDRDRGVTRHERVAFFATHVLGSLARADLTHDGTVHLRELEEPRVAERVREPTVVLRHRLRVVADVAREVERIEGRRAHAALPRGEGMRETVTLEQRRAEPTRHRARC
jgi:hypothetical protein